MKNNLCLSFTLILFVFTLVSGQTAKKTITNFELEKYKQQRLQAEAEYRAKYKELGMPSPEELEKQQQERKRLTEENLRQSNIERQRVQYYLQNQAKNLRNQIVSIETQMRLLKKQISTIPNYNPVFMTIDQFNQHIFIPFGYYNQEGVFVQTGFHLTWNNNLQQKEQLTGRIQSLGQTRAGLMSQWNKLAEEAHRVGLRID